MAEAGQKDVEVDIRTTHGRESKQWGRAR
jgi:hypothetical protein